jgi:hypothetical protein
VYQHKSKLHYAVVNKKGKELLVHVNRLQKAKDAKGWSNKWKEAKLYPPKRRDMEQKSEEEEITSPGPISSGMPQVDNQQPECQIQVRDQSQILDTPSPGSPPREPQTDYRKDPNFEPAETPRSRPEMETSRESPPLTRLRSRLQMLPEVPEEPMNVGPCHHGMARPQVADGGTASDMEGSCE